MARSKNNYTRTNNAEDVQQQQQEAPHQQQQGQQVAGQGQTVRQLLQTLLGQVSQLQASVSQLAETQEANQVMLSAQLRAINTHLNHNQSVHSTLRERTTMVVLVVAMLAAWQILLYGQS